MLIFGPVVIDSVLYKLSYKYINTFHLNLCISSPPWFLYVSEVEMFNVKVHYSSLACLWEKDVF